MNTAMAATAFAPSTTRNAPPTPKRRVSAPWSVAIGQTVSARTMKNRGYACGPERFRKMDWAALKAVYIAQPSTMAKPATWSVRRSSVRRTRRIRASSGETASRRTWVGLRDSTRVESSGDQPRGEEELPEDDRNHEQLTQLEPARRIAHAQRQACHEQRDGDHAPDGDETWHQLGPVEQVVQDGRRDDVGERAQPHSPALLPQRGRDHVGVCVARVQAEQRKQCDGAHQQHRRLDHLEGDIAEGEAFSEPPENRKQQHRVANDRGVVDVRDQRPGDNLRHIWILVRKYARGIRNGSRDDAPNQGGQVAQPEQPSDRHRGLSWRHLRARSAERWRSSAAPRSARRLADAYRKGG